MALKSEQLKIAICGHIDHGKSTLIGRLLLDTQSLPDDKIKELKKIAKDFGEENQLAHLSDQLKEERERNITIETTQIFFKTRQRSYCLIDTPGHLEFIQNMLTGTSQADTALLLVDINEGIKDQTRRHAYLLKFLSLPNIIVLVNKMDLANYSQIEFQKIETALSSLFLEIGTKPLHTIPVCAKHGENISCASKQIPWYRGPCLINALDAITSPKILKQTLRLPVQDIYNFNDQKVIVGRIASGTLREGQRILVLPQAQPATIKTIEIFNKKKKSADAEESIGVTLTADMDIQRGNTFCDEKTSLSPQKNFRGNIFWLSSTELVEGKTVELRCATQTFKCRVTKIVEVLDPADLTMLQKNTATLKKNQAGIIEFEILDPAVLEKHSDIPELGRFTVENNHELAAAGTVLSIS